MRLILIRHGETANNAGGVVQGRVDVPLNELGRRQAHALSLALRAEDVHAVVSSPLARARDTAAAIAAELGRTVTIEDDLAEMDVGEMEGLTGEQMRARHPEFLAVWASPAGPSLPMPGGESLQQVQDRAWATVERLRERYPDQTLVAVSHNFVISALACRAIRVPLAGFRRLRFNVASRTVIDFEPDRALVRHLNDTCHLDRAALRSAGPWERR